MKKLPVKNYAVNPSELTTLSFTGCRCCSSWRGCCLPNRARCRWWSTRSSSTSPTCCRASAPPSSCVTRTARTVTRVCCTNEITELCDLLFFVLLPSSSAARRIAKRENFLSPVYCSGSVGCNSLCRKQRRFLTQNSVIRIQLFAKTYIV